MSPQVQPVGPVGPIVVIDDDPDHLDMLSTLLERSGFGVVGFTVPREGLYYLLDNAAALTVIDLCMPDLNGVELVRRLQVSRPDLPVIGISGADDANLHLRTMRDSGAVTALRKPLAPARFLAAVRSNLRPA